MVFPDVICHLEDASVDHLSCSFGVECEIEHEAKVAVRIRGRGGANPIIWVRERDGGECKEVVGSRFSRRRIVYKEHVRSW
jgi:hypothetical protein